MVRRNLFTQTVILLLSVFAAAWAEDYSLVQFLNVQTCGNPMFGPTGRDLMFKTNISGVPQLWGMSSQGSYQRQVTFDTNGVAAASWSPTDEKLLIFSAAMGGNERNQLYSMNPYGGPVTRISKDDGAIYNLGPWTLSGERIAYATNARNKKDFDICEYEPATGDSDLIYRGEGTNFPAAYSPEARYLIIIKSHSGVNSDFYLYDFTTKASRLLTEHTGDIRYSDPVWDADGKGFYFITNRDREFSGIAFWPLDSTDFRWVETPAWDVEDIALSEDGSMLAWTVNENGYSRFNFRDFRRGWSAARNRTPDGVIHDLVFSRDGNYLAFTFGSGARPFDVWVYDTNADKLRQLTYSATGGIPPNVFREPELIHYESFDGRQIPAYWYASSDPDGKQPVIVAIHGGPENQARPDMSGLFQYFVHRGYAVLETNVRGSAGYGKEYLALDNVRKRMDSVKDIEFAVRWLAKRDDVDPKKIVAFGGSYGGFMVLSSLTTYPELWAAGVSVVGIANYVTFLQNTGIYRRALREAEYGTLAADSSFLVEISPLTHVDKIKAPLFLIQGANDPRVPKIEADQMADAIRTRGGVVEYMLFEDEGHGLSKLNNRIHAYGAVVEFLGQHVGKQ